MGSAEYGRLLTEAYDIDKPLAPPDELAFYRSHIERHGQPVLEAMSGSGRFLVPLLDAGIDIDGVDASPDMLAACERKCRARGLEPRQYQQDLQDLRLPRRYAFAFCGGGSFGLVISDEEVVASLRGLHDHLLPGGHLLLEVETPVARHDGPGGIWFGKWWRRGDGATIVMRSITTYDTHTRTESGLGIYELFVDGRQTESELNDWARRFWTAGEVAGALAAAGFVDVHVTKAYGTDPPDGSERELSVGARRPG